MGITYMLHYYYTLHILLILWEFPHNLGVGQEVALQVINLIPCN